MSNMSYCRFHNTVIDLRDCKEALEKLNDTDDEAARKCELEVAIAVLDEQEEEWTTAEEDEHYALTEEWEELDSNTETLSEDEALRAKELIRVCVEIAEQFGDHETLGRTK